MLYALGRWGARSLGPPQFDAELYPEWGLNALPALFDAVAARDLTETYVLKIGDDAFTARVVDGDLDALPGAAEDADLVAELDMETFFALASGELLPSAALAQGHVKIEGSEDALERCFRAFHMAPRTGAAPTRLDSPTAGEVTAPRSGRGARPTAVDTGSCRLGSRRCRPV